MGIKRIGGAVVAAALVLTAVVTGSSAVDAAGHKPPAPFTSTSLVVQKSIGGITLGSTAKLAGRGFTKKSCSASGCSYSGHGYTVYFFLARRTEHGKVFVGKIGFSASETSRTPATEIRTKDGVGIGSTVRQLKKGVPGLKGNSKDGFYVGDPTGNKLLTTFGFSRGRLSEIDMSNIHFG